MADEKKKRDKGGSFTAGFILLGLGLVFLLSNLGIIPDIGDVWPLFLIVIGAALVIGALRSKRADESSGTPAAGSVPPSPPTIT